MKHKNYKTKYNLTPFQRAELALVYKGLFVAKAKKNLSLTGGDKKSGLQNSVKLVSTFVRFLTEVKQAEIKNRVVRILTT